MGLKTQIRKLLWRTPYHNANETRIENKRQEKELLGWTPGKFIVPPHRIKQKAIIDTARKHGIKHLIETGTYMGEMIEATRRHFETVTSIELSEHLFRRATHRFRGIGNVRLLHGDSGQVLKKIVSNLDHPTLFWLDGHYSCGETAMGEKETPIFEELEVVLGRYDSGHIVLIDDAREFNDNPGYPSMDALMDILKFLRPTAAIRIENDCIYIEPHSTLEKGD
jgi:hypothetical protein